MNHRFIPICLAFIVFFFLSIAVMADEGDDSAVAPREEGKPFRFFPATPAWTAYVTELRSTVNRFEIYGVNRWPPQYPFGTGKPGRALSEIQLGVEVPLIGGDGKRYVWYLGLPVSFDLFMDPFEVSTAPIVNVDYWFGVRIEGLYRFHLPWPRNIGLRFIPFFHESTHIGDEFALKMAADDPAGFYRINISYQAWEISVGIDEWEGPGDNAYTLRAGVAGLWDPAGYYNGAYPYELGSALTPGDLYPSRGSTEVVLQGHVVRSTGFPAIGKWYFHFGIEARNRIRFAYFIPDPEQRVWGLNTTLGWYRPLEGARGRRIGFYLRFYAGQMPYGQFREADQYLLFGGGFTIGL